MNSIYQPRRADASEFVALRGLRLHVRCWGDPALATPTRPPLVLLHGWMDVGASFQFVVDALAAIEGESRCVIAPDWRGFGLSERCASDTYWFPDYLADLDALLDRLVPEGAIDLVSINDKVPADAKEAVEKVKAGLKDGSFVIWKGPIMSNDGKEVLKKDEVADDKFLGGINFFVKGVEGKVPSGK